VGPLHTPDHATFERAAEWVRSRLTDGAPLGALAGRDELTARLDPPSITAAGLGPAEAWRRFAEVIAPATVGLDSTRFLAFIPAAPSAAAVAMDGVVSAASFSGESWLEAAGAVHAENEVLEYLASLAGFPAGSGGCFVSGGSSGNLSALAVARDRRPSRTGVLVGDNVHASVANAAHLLGLRPIRVPAKQARLLGAAVAGALDADPTIGTVVASAGTTNAGVIDELAEIADACAAHDTWLHVDGAYGGAALLLPEFRERFAGLARADSFIVDPHKWLFAPLGSCALIYRDPALAKAVHTQHAPYLDSLHAGDAWNPSDFAYQLTRRAAGLAIWFALAVHGTEVHATAIRRGIELARLAADAIEAAGPPLELVMQPELSVVLFRRRGFTPADWQAWSRDLLAQGIAFVTPTKWRGETVGRLAFLHPDTPVTLIDAVLEPLLV
jgi:glutamate/tyrosine decarboxylase-like PLP-dependent enzyme